MAVRPEHRRLKEDGRIRSIQGRRWFAATYTPSADAHDMGRAIFEAKDPAHANRIAHANNMPHVALVEFPSSEFDAWVLWSRNQAPQPSTGINRTGLWLPGVG